MSDIEKKKMKNLDSLKIAEESDIPTKVIEIILIFLLPFCIKNLVSVTEKFPSEMKSANRIKKDNYRRINTSSNLSKVFERCIYNKLSLYFDNILSKYQC